MERRFSPYPQLHHECERAGNHLPLTWVRANRKANLSNLGDALSPVITTAISGLPPVQRHFNSNSVRLAACGTIGQNLSGGVAHMWGTGVDAQRRAFEPYKAPFEPAPCTEYVIHATRGPHSRATLLEAGLVAPPIYGDPAWFMPRIFKPVVEKTTELGVILHISELQEPAVTATPRAGLARYGLGEADGVRLISTWHEPSWDGMQSKMRELLACRRILSTSFHGLCLADAYGIPCAYVSRAPAGPQRLNLARDTEGVNHRFLDFYAAGSRSFLPGYGLPGKEETDWAKVIAAIDDLWEPVDMPCAPWFLEAFPFRRRVSLSETSWPLSQDEISSILW